MKIFLLNIFKVSEILTKSPITIFRFLLKTVLKSENAVVG